MPRLKTVLKVALVLGLAGLAFYLNMDWFTKRPIQISYRVSPWMKNAQPGRRRPASDLGTPVVFSLDSYYRLTSVKVVIASEIETNKYAHPLWNLVTASNSIPTASFAYGDRLRGMQPAVKGALPDPLEPGVTYRLLVTTKDNEARHDFTLTSPRP
jgi:hypothetical protein